MELNYLKNYCNKNTEFKNKLIEILEKDRKEKLSMARSSYEDEEEMYLDEADELQELIDYLK